tara:strand:+ start:377 stop:550 length:174 start_codon:yes stop_codon:yes gene_type:complete
MAISYKYHKQSYTNEITDVILTDTNLITWIPLANTSSPEYKTWKEWEAAGNTTEAAD